VRFFKRFGLVVRQRGEATLAAKDIDAPESGGLKKPSRGSVGNALLGPKVGGGPHGVLQPVFCGIKVAQGTH
jgi:hypothetical protein